MLLLPPVQGHAPIYKDKLTWAQICEVMVRFSIAHKKIKYKRKVPAVLKSIYSWRDVYRYGVLALTVLKFKLRYALFGDDRAPGAVGYLAH